MAIITLLTDFGDADSYVAEMKAALLTRAPGAILVDVSHHVPPGNVRMAQYLLSRCWGRFPAGTVHLVVVDPGVGTERRALAASAEGHAFVAPDNGVLSVLPRARFVALPVLRDASPTFHGRDVFAPAAARLAAGARLESLGSQVTNPHRLPVPVPRSDGDGTVVGEVVHVDHYGNLISNIPADLVDPGMTFTVATHALGALSRTFADVAVGRPLAYIGSGGTVEIAVRDGSAASLLGTGIGAEVRGHLANQAA